MSTRTLRIIKDDLDRMLPEVEMRRLFDVGGNVGQTARAMRALHPESEVWTFEPVKATFEQLREATAGDEGINAFNVAMGAAPAVGHMRAKAGSPNNRLLPEPVPGAEEVEVISGDQFCAERGIHHIDYLKIDTEGHELQVLRGFQDMLTGFHIDLIEAEAGMNFGNIKHTPFERLKGYLEPMGYPVFRLYEQVGEKRRVPFLRRVNVVFVSERVIAENTPDPA